MEEESLARLYNNYRLCRGLELVNFEKLKEEKKPAQLQMCLICLQKAFISYDQQMNNKPKMEFIQGMDPQKMREFDEQAEKRKQFEFTGQKSRNFGKIMSQKHSNRKTQQSLPLRLNMPVVNQLPGLKTIQFDVPAGQRIPKPFKKS